MDWDREILDLLNHDLANPVLDAILVFVSVVGQFGPYLVIGGAIAWRARGRDFAAFVLAVFIAEAVVIVLKGVIQRERPEDVRLLLGVINDYSMPSGHAVRAFAGAAALWTLGRPYRIAFFSFAGLTLVSRVYLGAHFPSDVLVGAGLGLLVGISCLLLSDAVAHELAQPLGTRAPSVRSVGGMLRATLQGMFHIDYLYTLRLLGRLSRDQAARLSRLSAYWGLVRFFGPLLMVAGAWVAYVILVPEYAGATAACLGGYIIPAASEVFIPTCVALGIPWWLVIAIIAYIDAWMTVFFMLNFDYLHRIPRLGRWLEKAQTKGVGFVEKHPWAVRIQFVGVALIVFLPLGTGILPGIALGRFIGMARTLVWLAVMLGTVTRVSLLAVAGHNLLRLLP